jgi:hypothetical protein
MSPAAPGAFEREVELFRQHGGGLRMSEALRLGINRKTLYAMRDAGVVEPVTRGLYRLASFEPLAHPTSSRSQRASRTASSL